MGIFKKIQEAVGFEPTISASISNPLPIELRIKPFEELEFNLFQGQFFSISRRKSRKCPIFRLEMEKNRLFIYHLIDSIYRFDCGRIDLIVGC